MYSNQKIDQSEQSIYLIGCSFKYVYKLMLKGFMSVRPGYTYKQLSSVYIFYVKKTVDLVRLFSGFLGGVGKAMFVLTGCVVT